MCNNITSVLNVILKLQAILSFYDLQESSLEDSINTDSDSIPSIYENDAGSPDYNDSEECQHVDLGEEEALIHNIIEALHEVELEDADTASDEYLSMFPLQDTLCDDLKDLSTIIKQEAMDDQVAEPLTHSASNLSDSEPTADVSQLEVSFETFNITEASTSSNVPRLENQKQSIPSSFGLNKQEAPCTLTRHPEPYVGRDDDPVKLREICDDVLTKVGQYQDSDVRSKILFGPDHKIGNNLIKLVRGSKKYDAFIPEFPCLHLRKSRITITLSSYKDAGLMQLLQYMRDDDDTSWAKLINIHHIDVATRNIKRLSHALHAAFIIKFSSTLKKEEGCKLLNELSSLPGPCVAEKWNSQYATFIEKGCKVNATFALHYDILCRLDSIVAISVAERMGGRDGHNLLLASTKETLMFGFLNGATSYSPYSVQLLYEHFRAGVFYGNMKQCLFSTPLKDGSANLGTDTKRELDHQDITKGFRSGSTMDSVVRRTALVDSLLEIHKTRAAERHSTKPTKSDNSLGWTLTSTDIAHIIPTVSLILKRGGLSLEPDEIPCNVYSKKTVFLSRSILNADCKKVGYFLVMKYLIKEGLFGCTINDLPQLTDKDGPKNLVDKAKKSQGVTIRRTSGKVAQERKSYRDQREEKRQSIVTNTMKKVQRLASDMNTCQAMVKPDCSKPPVTKSNGMSTALSDLLCTALGEGSDKLAKDKKGEILAKNNLVYLRQGKFKMGSLSSELKKVRIVSIEFAGVKFKTRVVSGLDYLKAVQHGVLENAIKTFPSAKHIIVCE
jgi:hypothetical protein